MTGSRLTHALLVATLALTTARDARAAIYAYIPGGGGNVVSRMDLATNEAIPITVGNGPVGVDASADGAIVVVSNSNDGTVSVIDGVTASVLHTVPVGSFPYGVGVTSDGAKAFVSNTGDQTISVVDTAAGTVTKTISVEGQLGAVAMSPSGHRAYVGNASFGGTVLVLDTALDIVLTETLVSTTSFVRSVVASPDGTRVYAGVDSAVAILDASTNLLVDEAPVTPDCCYTVSGLAITPDGTRLYASVFGSSGAIELDTTTLVATPLPSSSFYSEGNGVGVSPDGTTLYALNAGPGTIDLIDVATRTLVATLGALVEYPSAAGDFIAGPTPPIDPPAPPLLGSAARACQKAVLDSFKTYGAKAQQYLSGCLQRVQKDHAAGAVGSATTLACQRDVDPASATSRLRKARALARQRILTGCAASTPAALGAPCDAEASTMGELADCALDRQLAGVTSIVASQVTAPCGLLDLVGLGGAFPELCS